MTDFDTIPLDQIFVDRSLRQREELSDLTELTESIRKY